MAAAVLIPPPTPHASFTNMATSARRQPLMSIPNATNSPHRNLNNSGSKRSRAVANVSQQENEPPTKRQALDKPSLDLAPVTPRRPGQQEATESRVFERGNGDMCNSFQKKLVAARDRTERPAAPTKTTRSHNANTKDIESVRQWQKHYRKLFPNFHIYFDSVPDDTKARFVKQIQHLGAREEKFFSINVTHIITTRPIPDAGTVAKPSSNTQGTINPSVLDIKNGRSTVRRDAVNANDILVRGQQMDMKIWAADKLQKILATLFEERPGQDNAARTNSATRATNDLVQVLKSEKLAAVAEKEQAGIPRDLVPFRGPYLYVHDMDEKVKPIMVREYSKVGRRQDGEWPQFRSASMGKCPFVEDPVMKKELERERAQQKAQQLQQHKEAQKSAKARSATSSQTLIEPARMEPPRRTSPRKVLRDVQNQSQPSTVQQTAVKPSPVERQSSFPPMPEQPPVEFVKPSQMSLIREPSASGIQRSAMTSAIQSQMISSAAATGLKATTSKEVNELKRKVLERTHTGSLSVGSISSSHQVNAIAGVLKNARAPAPQRAAKSRAQEKLGGIQEEIDPYADDVAAERAAHAAAKKKKPARREPKPGYCENCHDKYDDFEDHCISRKHRKFAMTQTNWTELDALLAKLQAP